MAEENTIHELTSRCFQEMCSMVYPSDETVQKIQQPLLKELENDTKTHGQMILNRTNLNESPPCLHKQVFSSPSWPKCIIRVHSLVHSEHGSPFETIPLGKQPIHEALLIWVLSTLLVHVPEMWKIVNHKVTNDVDWYGYMLHYLGKEYFPQCSISQKQSNPFLNISNLFTKLHPHHQESSEYIFSPQTSLAELFTAIDDIQVCRYPMFIESATNEQKQATHRSAITIVTNICGKENEHDNKSTISDMMKSIQHEYPVLECRSILLSHENGHAETLSRHGTTNCSKWWFISGNGKYQLPIENLDEYTFDSWLIMVFVKISQTTMSDLQQKYLSLFGGQTRIKCRTHNLYLIRAWFPGGGVFGENSCGCLICSISYSPYCSGNGCLQSLGKCLGVAHELTVILLIHPYFHVFRILNYTR